MDIIIKQIDIDEIDKLMTWRMEVLHNVFQIPDDDDRKDLYAANRKYYLKSIPDESHIAVFAGTKDRTVGCGGLCLYSEMPSPDNPSGKCAYLMNIYTKKEYRGQGIGSAVLRDLIDKARSRGITKIYLETSACGRELYESLGFRDMADYMKLAENSHA